MEDEETNKIFKEAEGENPPSEKKGKIEFDDVTRVVLVDEPEGEVNFDEWRDTIHVNFPRLVLAAEFGLSVITQILIKDITNPFGLVLVDVPSAGKTIAINFFAEIEGLTYANDKFTPASFVSNAANVPKEKLKDIDLLPRLRYKMLLIRDLSTLFSKRDEDLKECLGILTRVLDGEGFNADTGVHGKRHYVGEFLFMILAGSTPIPPRVWNTMGNLGSRLFFLNMNSRDKTEQDLVNQLTSTAHKEKELECRQATKNFLYTLWKKYPQGVIWDKKNENEKDLLIIARCARLLARLRGTINVWKERNDDGVDLSYNSPVIEKPDRINQLFYNLCRGHALACGRTQINKDDLRLIVELSIDSSPTIRSRLFRLLLERGGEMKTSEVETALQCSKPTANKEMEKLKILGVCTLTEESSSMPGRPEKKMCLSKRFEWFLGEDCGSIRGIPLPPKQYTPADSV